MANWTQQEMEELIAKMTKKAMTDAEFRKEVLADATSALEKLAGRPLPEGASIKCVERDPNYQNTLVLPDLLDEEKLNDESLANVAGGVNIWIIVSVCGVAADIGPNVGACLSKMSVSDNCGADTCYTHSNEVTGCAHHSCHEYGERV